jgi:hypothetical protein
MDWWHFSIFCLWFLCDCNSVSLAPICLNFFVFHQHSLGIFMLWFCRAFFWCDMDIHFVASCTPSLPETVKGFLPLVCSVYIFTHLCVRACVGYSHLSQVTRSARLPQTHEIVARFRQDSVVTIATVKLATSSVRCELWPTTAQTVLQSAEENFKLFAVFCWGTHPSVNFDL